MVGEQERVDKSYIFGRGGRSSRKFGTHDPVMPIVQVDQIEELNSAGSTVDILLIHKYGNCSKT